VIIVTHDPRVARAVDRVVTIRDGRTSSETVRRVADVEAVLADDGSDSAESDAAYEEFLVVDAAGRLQLPDALLKSGAIGDRVTLEQTEQGILIKPAAGRASITVSPIVNDEPPSPTKTGRRSWLRRKQK
jgi:hypothetical protein